jgi:hypothetical protein
MFGPGTRTSPERGSEKAGSAKPKTHGSPSGSPPRSAGLFAGRDPTCRSTPRQECKRKLDPRGRPLWVRPEAAQTESHTRQPCSFAGLVAIEPLLQGRRIACGPDAPPGDRDGLAADIGVPSQRARRSAVRVPPANAGIAWAKTKPPPSAPTMCKSGPRSDRPGPPGHVRPTPARDLGRVSGC